MSARGSFKPQEQMDHKKLNNRCTSENIPSTYKISFLWRENINGLIRMTVSLHKNTVAAWKCVTCNLSKINFVCKGFFRLTIIHVIFVHFQWTWMFNNWSIIENIPLVTRSLFFMQPSKTTLNLPSSSLHLCSPLKEIRRVKIHHQFTSFPK